MNSNRQRLLEDALLPSTLTDSLAAVRRAARHRRVLRRSARAAIVACLIAAGAWLYGLSLQGTTNRNTPVAGSEQIPPPFVLVTNGPPPSGVIMRTAAAPASLIVTTRAATGSITPASQDDLFASAGSRPAGLHHLPDGTARWMWLDQPELP